MDTYSDYDRDLPTDEMLVNWREAADYDHEADDIAADADLARDDAEYDEPHLFTFPYAERDRVDETYLVGFSEAFVYELQSLTGLVGDDLYDFAVKQLRASAIERNSLERKRGPR